MWQEYDGFYTVQVSTYAKVTYSLFDTYDAVEVFADANATIRDMRSAKNRHQDNIRGALDDDVPVVWWSINQSAA